uniref:palmitoyl-CoA hydrolase n=1 Tax=Cyclopterus lumpus TaxID=8103 RepID=A0A8C2ZJN1_CYCLU
MTCSPALLRLLLPLLLSGTVRIDGYRPVIIVHGIFDGPKQFKTLSLYITKTHPGTEVSVIDLYDNLASLRPLWRQVQDFSQAFDSIVRKAPEGVHLLCFSQGGLICRALLSVASHHNVHTFVSLSAPQAGQYGDTDYLKWLFPDYVKRTLFRICYSSMGQKLSFCDYWNDPHHRYRYLQSNTFLPMLNGERPHINMKEVLRWKKTTTKIFKHLNYFVYQLFPIFSHFGFYDVNENIVEMRNQEFYKSDTFGLKALEARGDVELCVHSGVKHVQWHSNHTVFTSCIEKWLT